MYFTEGRLREFERMMKEIPQHERKPVKAALERDCKHCLHYSKQLEKCSKEKCANFKE